MFCSKLDWKLKLIKIAFIILRRFQKRSNTHFVSNKWIHNLQFQSLSNDHFFPMHSGICDMGTYPERLFSLLAIQHQSCAEIWWVNYKGEKMILLENLNSDASLLLDDNEFLHKKALCSTLNAAMEMMWVDCRWLSHNHLQKSHLWSLQKMLAFLESEILLDEFDTNFSSPSYAMEIWWRQRKDLHVEILLLISLIRKSSPWWCNLN